jgi:hypothetical protein
VPSVTETRSSWTIRTTGATRTGRGREALGGVEVRASLPRDLWGHVVRQVREQGLGCGRSGLSSRVCGGKGMISLRTTNSVKSSRACLGHSRPLL